MTIPQKPQAQIDFKPSYLILLSKFELEKVSKNVTYYS